MISDGFGDALTTDELVENFQRYAHYWAHQTQHRPADHDDIAQEAMISVWKAAVRKGTGAASGYYATAAKNAAVGLASGKRRMTGYDGIPRPSRPEEVELSPALLLEAPEILAAVEWAYHAGELAEVLSALPEPDHAYVVMRFWYGLNDIEIAAQTGDRRGYWNDRWKRNIKPVLARQLAHLGV